MKVKTQPKLAKEEENGAKNGSVSKTKPKIKTKQKNKVEEGGVPSRDPATLILQNRFSEHPVHNLSLGQIGVGLVAILTQLVVSLANDVHLGLSTLGEGVFCGVVFITVGSLGVFTAARTNMFTVRSFMISNISALLFSLVLLVLSSCLLVDIIWYQEADNYAMSGFYILKTAISLQIVLAIIEIILSVTCGSMAYKSMCLNRNTSVVSHRYPAGSVKFLAYLHVVTGSSLVLFFITLFTFSFDSRHSLTCEEIYCGLVFIGIGLFGLYTIKTVSLTSLTPFMILNIFGVIFASVMMTLACVRIFMMDRVHDNYLLMKQEDLILLPRLNCTQDVIESLHHNQNAPKVFGQMSHSPSPAEIKTNIEECERMKTLSIRDAEEVLSTGATIGVSGPRTIYQLEIGLGLLELVTALVCVALCCRACCCTGPLTPRSHSHNAMVPVPSHDTGLTAEEEKWNMVVQEYNEYRK